MTQSSVSNPLGVSAGPQSPPDHLLHRVMGRQERPCCGHWLEVTLVSPEWGGPVRADVCIVLTQGRQLQELKLLF